MWNCPISGSQINQPAKLYKRFTPTEDTVINKVITEEYVNVAVGMDLSGKTIYFDKDTPPTNESDCSIYSTDYVLRLSYSEGHSLTLLDNELLLIEQIFTPSTYESVDSYVLPIDFGEIVSVTEDVTDFNFLTIENPDYGKPDTTQSRTIIVESNYYRTYASIAYVEATDKQEGEEQPLRGLPSHSANMTIKYNGEYKPKAGNLYECEADDLLSIDGELWIIEDGIQRVRNKSLINFATVYVPVRRLM